MSLRIAAISFLNPAPLLYNFEHEPEASRLSRRYSRIYTTPAQCARQLHSGEADLGLIPIAELTSELVIVPGCTIASLHRVRSILLLVKNPGQLPAADALARIRTVAADAASRSSTAYLRVLLERFHANRPAFTEHPADPLPMLAAADAALLIGDPALLARERRTEIDAAAQASSTAQAADAPLLWLDLAELWREHTGLPWVAAVWALRPQALNAAGLSPAELIADLSASRDAGLAHIDELVREWTPRLSIPAATIRAYLTENIHYTLDPACLAAIELFRSLAADIGALPSLSTLPLLHPDATPVE